MDKLWTSYEVDRLPPAAQGLVLKDPKGEEKKKKEERRRRRKEEGVVIRGQ